MAQVKVKKLKKGQLPISVMVLTKNEELNLPGCLKSLAFAGQVVVVDSQSTDKTRFVAKAGGAEVFNRPWPGYAQQRNFALSKCRFEWVLSVDADERVAPDLREFIVRLFEQGPQFRGYQVPEVNLYFGKWLRWGGVYPSSHMVLFSKIGQNYEAKAGIHEGVHLPEAGLAGGHLIHHAYPEIELALEKLNPYTDLECSGRWDMGKRAGLYGLVFRPLRVFVSKYIFKAGFLDGVQGLLYCVLASYYTFIFHAKLWERASK